MTFFFILSGFVFYYSKAERARELTAAEHYRWWSGRVLKFYPVYAACFLISIPVKYAEIAAWQIPELIARTASVLTMTQSLFGKCVLSYNNASWYLSALIIIYFLIFPFLKLTVRLNRFWTFAAAVMILLIQAGLNLAQTPVLDSCGIELYLYYNPFYRITDFLLGMLTAKLFLDKKDTAPKLRLAEPAVAAGIILMYIAVYFIDYPLEMFIYNSLLMLLLYVYAFQAGKISERLSSKPIVRIAEFSFEFYMIHELVLIVFRRLIPDIGAHWAIRAALVAAPAFAVAVPASMLLNKLSAYINVKLTERTKIQ